MTELDLVFILDRSGSINAVEFNSMKDFVKSLIDLFGVAADGVRVGLVTFSTNPTIQFELDDSFDTDTVKAMIDAIVGTGGGTNIGWYK